MPRTVPASPPCCRYNSLPAAGPCSGLRCQDIQLRPPFHPRRPGDFRPSRPRYPRLPTVRRWVIQRRRRSGQPGRCWCHVRLHRSVRSCRCNQHSMTGRCRRRHRTYCRQLASCRLGWPRCKSWSPACRWHSTARLPHHRSRHQRGKLRPGKPRCCPNTRSPVPRKSR